MLHNQSIAKVLKELRKAKKYRQQEIARLSSLTQSELSNFENERVDVRLSTLKRIADALDMSIIAVPKNKLTEIEAILSPGDNHVTNRPLTPLEKYGISDDDD